jgi:hypothetical protein
MALQDLLDDVTTPLEVCVEVDSVLRDNVPTFDGSGDYVTFGDVLDQGATDSFTVEMLFSAATAAAASQVFMSKIAPSINNNTAVGWGLWRWSGDPTLIFLDLGDGTTGDFIELSWNVGAFYDGLEHRLSLVVDRTAQRAYLYIDGNLINAGGTDISAIGSLSNASPLYLARDPAGFNYIGTQRDFRFWSVARTQSEIVSTLRAGSVSSTATGLALHAPMNEGFGTKVTDLTGNSRHGTVVGATWTELSRTWYFSTRSRLHGPSDTPANTEFFPYLLPYGSIGPLAQSLTEDTLFADIARVAPGSLQVVQEFPTSAGDRLSQLQEYVFDGREVRVMIGEAGSAYSGFYQRHTLRCAKDPDITLTDDGLQAQWQLASSLDRTLAEPLDVPRYAGIPHALKLLTATGQVNIPKVASHDASRFVAAIRFRASSITSTRRLFAKIVSGTDCHFLMDLLSGGSIHAITSSSGASDISEIFSLGLADSAWHVAALARDNDARVYLLVDRTVVKSWTPTGSTNLSNTSLNIGLSGGGDDLEVCDARLYNRYIPPEELIGLLSSRATAGDLGLVGYWPFTDNAGGTVNDEGTGNSDGTIAGVLNTDYSWGPSDLGEAELSGRPHPLAIGDFFNAQAHLIDNARERYRLSSEDQSAAAVTIRSQGTTLSGGGVDYTLSDLNRLAQMTAQEAEPVTFDYRHNSFPPDSYPSALAREILINYTRLTSAMISERWDSMLNIVPARAGYYTDQENVTAAQVLKTLLGESGMYYTESELGLLYMDALLPPVGFGPFGDPAFDFNGGRASDIKFVGVDLSAGTSSMTMCGWINTPAVDGTGGFSDTQTLYLPGTQLGTSYDYLRFVNSGSQYTQIQFKAGTNARLDSPVNPLLPFQWYFVAGVFNDTANTTTIYVAPLGGQLVAVATSAVATGMRTAVSSDLTVGSRLGDDAVAWGALQHVQVYSVAKTLAELQAIMANPDASTTGRVRNIAMNEGSGLPVESVSGVTGTAQGLDHFTHRWAPKLVVDVDENPYVSLTEYRNTVPASHIDVQYARNWRPLSPGGEIDSGLSQTVRWSLMREHLSLPVWNDELRERHLFARRVLRDSPLSQYAGAYRLARMDAARFSVGRAVGRLSFPAATDDEPAPLSRRSLSLAVGDEIGIVSSVPVALAGGRSYRVTAVAPDPLSISNTIGFWG